MTTSNGDIIILRRGCIVQPFSMEIFMNKFSLLSMAMSFLFCSYINATEQQVAEAPVPSPESTESKSDAVPAPAENHEANAAQQAPEKIKRPKVSKKKKCKKTACAKSHKKGDDITEKLNKGEGLNSAEAPAKTDATPANKPAELAGAVDSTADAAKTEIKKEQKAETK